MANAPQGSMALLSLLDAPRPRWLTCAEADAEPVSVAPSVVGKSPAAPSPAAAAVSSVVVVASASAAATAAAVVGSTGAAGAASSVALCPPLAGGAERVVCAEPADWADPAAPAAGGAVAAPLLGSLAREVGLEPDESPERVAGLCAALVVLACTGPLRVALANAVAKGFAAREPVCAPPLSAFSALEPPSR
jgi:hypothetical protein